MPNFDLFHTNKQQNPLMCSVPIRLKLQDQLIYWGQGLEVPKTLALHSQCVRSDDLCDSMVTVIIIGFCYQASQSLSKYKAGNNNSSSSAVFRHITVCYLTDNSAVKAKVDFHESQSAVIDLLCG